MGVGQGALVGYGSYMAIGREQSFGAGGTSTAGLNTLSEGLTTQQEAIILEEITGNRNFQNHIYGGKNVGGPLEAYFSPRSSACMFLLMNAFGANLPTSSATATGDTAGAATFTHVIDIGNFVDGTYSSLCINERKGQSAGGKIFEYIGCRVGEFGLTAEMDDAVKFSATIVAKDSTVTGNDVSAGLNTANQIPLSFVGGRLSIETSEAAQTSTSYWQVHSIKFNMNNQLMTDEASRAIGSNTLQVLPAGVVQYEFTAVMRFDTTTAHDAMINNTRLYGEMEFVGATMAGSKLRESLKLNFANLRITDPGTPEVGGPNEILTAEVSFAVLRDGTTSTGYAVRATVTNDTASYN